MDKYRFILKIVCGVLVLLAINTVLILNVFFPDTISKEVIIALSGADVAVIGYIFAHNIKPNNKVDKD